MRIAIINGPNLAQVGTREPLIYGSTPLPRYLEELRRAFAPQGVEITPLFSNGEGEVIDALWSANQNSHGIILNAGAYTHTSLAIADCLRALQVPVIEVHISNIFAREEIRRTSLTAPYCCGVISGLGVEGYRYALHALLDRLQ